MADDIIFRMKKDSLLIVREKEEYSSSPEDVNRNDTNHVTSGQTQINR